MHGLPEPVGVGIIQAGTSRCSTVGFGAAIGSPIDIHGWTGQFGCRKGWDLLKQDGDRLFGD